MTRRYVHWLIEIVTTAHNRAQPIPAILPHCAERPEALNTATPFIPRPLRLVKYCRPSTGAATATMMGNKSATHAPVVPFLPK